MKDNISPECDKFLKDFSLYCYNQKDLYKQKNRIKGIPDYSTRKLTQNTNLGDDYSINWAYRESYNEVEELKRLKKEEDNFVRQTSLALSIFIISSIVITIIFVS